MVQKQYKETLNVYRSQMARYTGLVQQIKEKSKERKALVAEKKELPIYHVKRHKALAVRIAELTEDLEELRSEKALLFQKLEYAEDAGAEEFRKDIATMEACLKKLETREQKYSVELETVLQEYAGVKAQSTGLDPVELYEARHAIRSGYEAAVNEKLEQAYGEKYSPLRWMEAKRAQAKLTNDSMEEYAARKLAKQKYKSMSQPIRGWKQEQER